MADLNKFVQFRVKAPLLLGGHHDVPRRTGRYFGISQINAKSTATVLLVPPWFVKINTKIFLSYLLFELFKAENVDEDWMRGYMQQILLHSSYAYNYSSRIMKLSTYILLSSATASIRSRVIQFCKYNNTNGSNWILDDDGVCFQLRVFLSLSTRHFIHSLNQKAFSSHIKNSFFQKKSLFEKIVLVLLFWPQLLTLFS